MPKNKEEKEYQLKLNDEYRVAIANDLIKGHQKMTLRESQLLSIAISNVVKEDKDLKTYTTTIIELSQFLGVDERALYKDIRGICRNLIQRIVEVQTAPNKWEIYSWVQSAKYDNGKLTLRLSDDLKPYLIDLKQFYSQPLLSVLLTFRSYYAKRLYEYLIAVDGAKSGVETWNFTCDELRELFQTKDLYTRNYNLIQKTIKPAIAELNSTDYVYIYDYEEYFERSTGKRGKPSLAGVRFKAQFFDKNIFPSAAERKALFVECVKNNVFDKLKTKSSEAAENAEGQMAMPWCESMPEPPENDEQKPKKRGRPRKKKGE